ncbi:MAG TPA: hypothetical protein DEA50_06025 [Parvularcula sp.]|nr:hypothetical protein [Parvularcula sp.]
MNFAVIGRQFPIIGDPAGAIGTEMKMNFLVKQAVALASGLAALGAAAAFADEGDHRRGRERDGDRYSDARGGERYDNRRGGEYRDATYRDGRPEHCDLDHDHRYHNRDYYNYYPKDRYYKADPEFSVSLSYGKGGYYDRGGRYYDRPYYDRRGYRDYGQVVDRDVYRIRGYRAEAIVVEEAFGGGRGYGRLVCTVTARGPDARYVPYGQLRRIANSACSGRSEIRIYA